VIGLTAGMVTSYKNAAIFGRPYVDMIPIQPTVCPENNNQ